MIVRSTDGDLLLVRQTDHAALSGALAREWGNDTFVRPEPFDSVCLASALHDNGWLQWDGAPKIDPATGFPYQFTDLPVEEHLTFYLRGIAQVMEQDRYAGLLVSMHCSGIYKQRYGTDPGLKLRRHTPEVEHVVQDFLSRLESQQKDLRAELRGSGALKLKRSNLEEAAIWSNYKLLQMMDRLSLYFCMAPITPRILGSAPLDYEENDVELSLNPVNDDAVVISPYPFRRSPLHISVEARVLPKQAYQSDEHLRATLACAMTHSLSFIVLRSA